MEKKLQDLLLSLPISFTIEFRIIEVDLNTKSIIVLVDRKESLVIEVKDNAKDIFKNTIGLLYIQIACLPFYLIYLYLKVSGNSLI